MEEEKKIYIGNLEYGATQEEIASMLSDKGITAQSVKIITDKYTGKSKGFGFAEFATEEEAKKAIEILNGQELNGRALRVSRAQKSKPRQDRFGGGGSGGGSGGGRRFGGGRDRRE